MSFRTLWLNTKVCNAPNSKVSFFKFTVYGDDMTSLTGDCNAICGYSDSTKEEPCVRTSVSVLSAVLKWHRITWSRYKCGAVL